MASPSPYYSHKICFDVVFLQLISHSLTTLFLLMPFPLLLPLLPALLWPPIYGKTHTHAHPGDLSLFLPSPSPFSLSLSLSFPLCRHPKRRWRSSAGTRWVAVITQHNAASLKQGQHFSVDFGVTFWSSFGSFNTNSIHLFPQRFTVELRVGLHNYRKKDR